MDSGPDQILPADCLTTTQPDGCVKLRNQTDNDPLSPLSVVSLMKRTVDQYGDQIALRVKRNDEWLEWSYQQYWDEAKIVAKAFIKLGLKRHHSGTCSYLEWFQQNNAVQLFQCVFWGSIAPNGSLHNWAPSWLGPSPLAFTPPTIQRHASTSLNTAVRIFWWPKTRDSLTSSPKSKNSCLMSNALCSTLDRPIRKVFWTGPNSWRLVETRAMMKSISD